VRKGEHRLVDPSRSGNPLMAMLGDVAPNDDRMGDLFDLMGGASSEVRPCDGRNDINAPHPSARKSRGSWPVASEFGMQAHSAMRILP
jgi:hypothetical protein